MNSIPTSILRIVYQVQKLLRGDTVLVNLSNKFLHVLVPAEYSKFSVIQFPPRYQPSKLQCNVG
jgi:hypothetical protein